MPNNAILIAVDSVGIDPLGHDRIESVYGGSRFLFPAGRSGALISLPEAPVPGALVETDVAGGRESGGIECAITYTSIFSGQSALEQHGLMHGLGLSDRVLEGLVDQQNLFARFANPCLANALFPGHLPFLGSSYVEEMVPHFDREAVQSDLRFQGRPVGLKGKQKNGFAELFTLAEINQNIFVYAAQQAGLPLLTWDDVRRDEALTSSMTHELEADFNLDFFGQQPLPPRTPEEAAKLLVAIARKHEFTFYKYQVPDLISHTGRVGLAREVFETIERFVETVLKAIDADATIVAVTSDHGHLEQVAYLDGHPKSKVPTWYFGPDAEEHAAKLTRPEALFDLLVQQCGRTTQEVVGQAPRA